MGFFWNCEGEWNFNMCIWYLLAACYSIRNLYPATAEEPQSNDEIIMKDLCFMSPLCREGINHSLWLKGPLLLTWINFDPGMDK